jgi:5-methylcytosine-specific restriction endonuclease McrA
MSSLSNNIGLLLLVAYIIYFVVYYLSGIYKTYKETKTKQQAKKKEETEIRQWLENDEVKERYQHTYPQDWAIRRKFIAQRANYTCKICGRRGWLGFHVHHVLPLSKGGNNALDNLVYLCKWCHENQHEHMIAERERRHKRIDEISKKAYWKRYWAKKRASQSTKSA